MRIWECRSRALADQERFLPRVLAHSYAQCSDIAPAVAQVEVGNRAGALPHDEMRSAARDDQHTQVEPLTIQSGFGEPCLGDASLPADAVNQRRDFTRAVV